MTLTTPIIRPLRAEDLGEVLPYGIRGTTRGYVAEIDGKIVGSMGVIHGYPPQAFSDMKPELREYPRFIVSAIRRFQEMLEENYVFVIAAASKDEAGSVNVLRRVGFKQFTRPTEDHRGLFAWRKQ